MLSPLKPIQSGFEFLEREVLMPPAFIPSFPLSFQRVRGNSNVPFFVKSAPSQDRCACQVRVCFAVFTQIVAPIGPGGCSFDLRKRRAITRCELSLCASTPFPSHSRYLYCVRSIAEATSSRDT